MKINSHFYLPFLFYIYLFTPMQDPSSLTKAQEEVDRVLQGRAPSYEDVKELKFLTRCIIESMRLYPHPPVCYVASVFDTIICCFCDLFV